MSSAIIEIPELYVLVDNKGNLVHHAGKSTGRGPMVYDDLRSANRAHSRMPGTELKVIRGVFGLDIDFADKKEKESN